MADIHTHYLLLLLLVLLLLLLLLQEPPSKIGRTFHGEDCDFSFQSRLNQFIPCPRQQRECIQPFHEVGFVVVVVVAGVVVVVVVMVGKWRATSSNGGCLEADGSAVCCRDRE
jgi:preprotein translocase subunit SecG